MLYEVMVTQGTPDGPLHGLNSKHTALKSPSLSLPPRSSSNHSALANPPRSKTRLSRRYTCLIYDPGLAFILWETYSVSFVAGECASPSHTSVPRKPRKFWRTNMNQIEERLAEEVRKSDHLYNPSLTEYKDAQMACDSWKEISANVQ
ncbi:unnamed protein product [Pleuronectes platessa]|uniref:Uncharacterized protein n=1 Tax=Pleuronectes platessa TaxID=8262 RepID=A0A9N7VM54_PLEPL|nr:unnamed protein product [Pleuronectes platessa]